MKISKSVAVTQVGSGLNRVCIWISTIAFRKIYLSTISSITRSHNVFVNENTSSFYANQDKLRTHHISPKFQIIRNDLNSSINKPPQQRLMLLQHTKSRPDQLRN